MITLAPERPDILAVTVDLPELVGKSTCNYCWHPRKTHPNGGGCTYVDAPGNPKCGCPMTYMDLRLDPTAVLSEQSHPPGCQCLWCAPWRDDR